MSKEPTTTDFSLESQPLKVVEFLEELSRASDSLTLQPWAEKVLESIEDSSASQLQGPTFERIMLRTFKKHQDLFIKQSEPQDAVCVLLTEVGRLCKNDESLSWLATIFLSEYQHIVSSFPDGLSSEDARNTEKIFAAAFIHAFGIEMYEDQAKPTVSETVEEEKRSDSLYRKIDRFSIYTDGTIEVGDFRHTLEKAEFKLLKILLDPADVYHSFDKLIDSLFKASSTRPKEYKIAVLKRLVSSLISKLNTIGLDLKIIENSNLQGVIFHSSYVTKPPPARYEMSGTIIGKKKSSG